MASRRLEPRLILATLSADPSPAILMVQNRDDVWNVAPKPVINQTNYFSSADLEAAGAQVEVQLDRLRRSTD